MVRSFTDRVLGGVCGGIGASLRLNSWLVRVLFIALTVVSLGSVALLYLALWWALPLPSPAQTQRGSFGGFLIFVMLTAAMIGAWAGREMGWLRGANGQDLYVPVLLLVLSVVFFLKQVRA
jgi:phage shock protein PspC (stress-responsive transcriptional regulator)